MTSNGIEQLSVPPGQQAHVPSDRKRFLTDMPSTNNAHCKYAVQKWFHVSNIAFRFDISYGIAALNNEIFDKSQRCFLGFCLTSFYDSSRHETLCTFKSFIYTVSQKNRTPITF